MSPPTAELKEKRKFFWQLDKPPNVPKNICKQYNNLKKSFRIFKTEEKVKK